MDSMRSLNTSLPRSPPNRHRRRRRPSRHQQQQQQQQAPSAELLQAFKAAARSVTELYKTAAVSEEDTHRRGHEAGYQDAVDDLLDFLDQENMGLADGEGWRVREWATRRHASLSSTGSAGQGDAGMEETPRETRSESPSGQGENMNVDQAAARPEPKEARASSSPPMPVAQAPQQVTPESTKNEVFTFRSPVSMPPAAEFDFNNPASQPAVKLGMLQRQMRNARHGHGGRELRSHGTATGPLGHGAGVKRKFALNDFFDIGSGSGPSGGFNKKGRFT